MMPTVANEETQKAPGGVKNRGVKSGCAPGGCKTRFGARGIRARGGVKKWHEFLH